MDNKYRVHEVAKDFGLATKDITNIMTERLTTPKNHMQVLSDDELNVIFETLTQAHQVTDLEAFLTPKKVAEPAPKKETPAAEPTKEEVAEPKVETKQPERQTPAKGTKVIVDTRKGGQVDLGRYDEHVDELVPDKAQNISSAKQKIKRNSDRRQQNNFGQKRRQEEQEKMARLAAAAAKKPQLKITIPDEISVGELASRLKRTGTDVVKALIKQGIMASVSEVIDYDTAALIAMDLGAKVEKEVVVTIEDRLIDVSEDDPATLKPRDPVVVVMGHVDHGKTSLLDAIRKTNVVSGEAGGITQHIGAYRVKLKDRYITFLDTPGHAAFTSMRARGAQVTDVAILIVAADDGIMPQTIEAINHAKAAKVPIIVAINKMDKPDATPDRVMQQLTEYDLVPEDWGGDTIVCPISALKGDGIPQLLEMVLLSADMLELKANPDRTARGTVIEAKLDAGRGPVATILVQNGTLKSGDVIIAGKSVGRVRAMRSDRGDRIEKAYPSWPVEITGLGEVPDAGDLFYAVEDERMARELVEQRKYEEKMSGNTAAKVSLDDLFAQIQEGNVKELNIVVKADVQGSVEAVKASLEKLGNEEVRVKVIHAAVGAVNESDIMLATASNAIIVGFNIRPSAAISDAAERAGVDMRMYRIIYDCIEEIEAAIKGMLAPTFREVVLGHAEVRQTFKVSKVGTIAGCYVQDGKIVRNCTIRLLRDGVIVHEGELSSLRRFKDDVKEVLSGYECGLSIDRFNDLKEGDIIEATATEEVKA